MSNNWAFGLILGAAASVALPTGAGAALLAQYGFEEGSVQPDFRTADAAGGNEYGVLTPNAPYAGPTYVDGRVGNHALQFTSSAQRVDLKPSGGDLLAAGRSGVTIAAWVRLTASTGMHVVGFSTEGGASSSRAVLGYEHAGQTVFIAARDVHGTTLRSLNSTTTVAAGADVPWVHLAAVIDYAGDSLQLYVNGAPAGSVPGTADSSFFGNSASASGASLTAAIGGWNGFIGQIDDVRIYDQALTASEIATVVPEPSVFGALAAAALIAVRRRRA